MITANQIALNKFDKNRIGEQQASRGKPEIAIFLRHEPGFSPRVYLRKELDLPKVERKTSHETPDIILKPKNKNSPAALS